MFIIIILPTIQTSSYPARAPPPPLSTTPPQPACPVVSVYATHYVIYILVRIEL